MNPLQQLNYHLFQILNFFFKFLFLHGYLLINLLTIIPSCATCTLNKLPYVSLSVQHLTFGYFHSLTVSHGFHHTHFSFCISNLPFKITLLLTIFIDSVILSFWIWFVCFATNPVDVWILNVPAIHPK